MVENYSSEEPRKFTATRRHALKLATGTTTAITVNTAPTTAQNQTREEWVFEADLPFSSSPTVVNGTIYVGNDDNNLYAIDVATGNEQWAFLADDRVISSPTVVDGTVFVGSSDNNLYAVDVETGDQQWVFETDSVVTSSPTIVSGTVFVGSYDGTLYAVDAETGNQQWALNTFDAIVASSPTVVDGTVFVGSTDTNLYAVEAETGDQQWAFATGDAIFCSPTVVDGTVFFGSEDGNFYAVDTDTGDQRWAFDTGAGVERSSPTVIDGTAFVGSQDGNLYAVDIETGDQQWAFDTGGVGSDVNSSPTVVEETVFVGSSDNNLYAVDADTGDQQWVFETNRAVESSPTVVEGIVFVGNNEGNLYAIDADVEGSSEGSRVNLGTLGHHHVWAEEAAQRPNMIFEPTDGEVAFESELSYDLVVEDITDGVSAYEFTATLEDTSVATITEAELVAFGGESANIDVGEDGSSVFFEEAVGDAGLPGDAFTIARVTITAGETEGTTQLQVADDAVLQNNDGANYEFDKLGTATVAVVEEVAPDVTSDGNPAQDLNEDGLYEDVNGDGSTDIFDVQALWNNRQTDAVQDNVDLFDFAGGGDIDIFDIQALFNQT